MKSVARKRKSVHSKEADRNWPEAGCLPVEDQILADDEAVDGLALSQQDAHE